MSSARARRRAREPFVLEDFLPYRLSVLTNVVSRALAREYTERFDLAVLEWRVIAVVGRFAPMTAGEVSERTAMDKVAVSRAVQALVARGLLEREVDPQDRRRAQLSLSARGRGIRDAVAPRAEALERELVGALSPDEHEQLDRLLAKLTTSAAKL
jgi:DNA-binding MarR family transcriptional regulator